MRDRQLQSLRQQYKPNLDYGVTYLPVPNKADPAFSWSSGFPTSQMH